MKRNIVLALLSLVVFSTLSSKLSQAQGWGSIAGTITDPTGAAIASAQIAITQIGTGFAREAATDAEGYYVVPSLRPADYTVVIKARGFSDSRQNVTLLADQTLTLNLALKVGSGNEIIEVQGNAPQVDTMTSYHEAGGRAGKNKRVAFKRAQCRSTDPAVFGHCELSQRRRRSGFHQDISGRGYYFV